MTANAMRNFIITSSNERRLRGCLMLSPFMILVVALRCDGVSDVDVLSPSYISRLKLEDRKLLKVCIVDMYDPRMGDDDSTVETRRD